MDCELQFNTNQSQSTGRNEQTFSNNDECKSSIKSNNRLKINKLSTLIKDIEKEKKSGRLLKPRGVHYSGKYGYQKSSDVYYSDDEGSDLAIEEDGNDTDNESISNSSQSSIEYEYVDTVYTMDLKSKIKDQQSAF